MENSDQTAEEPESAILTGDDPNASESGVVSEKIMEFDKLLHDLADLSMKDIKQFPNKST